MEDATLLGSKMEGGATSQKIRWCVQKLEKAGKQMIPYKLLEGTSLADTLTYSPLRLILDF